MRYEISQRGMNKDTNPLPLALFIHVCGCDRLEVASDVESAPKRGVWIKDSRFFSSLDPT